MKTTDETIYTAEAVKEETKTTQKDNSMRDAWKPVSIGGITGILMGAAGALAAQSVAAENPAEENPTADDETTSVPDGVQVAEVRQNLSFGQAFAEAREQVGAGGVFVWHGNIYNTFTAEEWNAMDSEQRNEFAQSVQPLVSVAEQTAHSVASHTSSHTTSHTSTHTVEHSEEQVVQDAQTVSEEGSDEPEVHFLGMETVHGDNGETVNVGRLTVDNVAVALVDVDDDQVFDFRLTDLNNNGEVDEDEVQDISEAGLTIQDFNSLAEAEHAQEGAQLEQASLQQQDDLAPDMPDYMNDADINLI